jgi:hypothetical protein
MVHRLIILHYHIFKNAGTSFDAALSKAFGDERSFISHWDNEAMIKGGQPYLEEFLARHERLKAIASHEFCFKARDSFRFKYIPVTFIRCPILRALSVYKFERAQTDVKTHGSIKAKEVNSFEEFVGWYLNESPSKTITNFQIRRCALDFGCEQTDAIFSEDYLENAKKNLKNYFNFGIVESYTHSLEKLSLKLNLKLGVEWLNTTGVRKTGWSLDKERDEVLSQMGRYAHLFLSQNKNELKFYDYAVRLHSKQ